MPNLDSVLTLALACGGSMVALFYMSSLHYHRMRRGKARVAHVRASNDAFERLLAADDVPPDLVRYARTMSHLITDPDARLEFECEMLNPSRQLSEEEVQALEEHRQRLSQLMAARPDLAVEVNTMITSAASFLICSSKRLSERYPDLAERLIQDPGGTVGSTIRRRRERSRGKSNGQRLLPA